jgi:hypothetical protein
MGKNLSLFGRLDAVGVAEVRAILVEVRGDTQRVALC